MKKICIALSALLGIELGNGQNVGIGNFNPTHARLEINGSVGAAVAMFGADKNGVTIQADNPEIGFNYFYNGGTKTIKAGYAGILGMNPGTGEIYIGNFGGNQSSADFGPVSGYRQNLTLFQNGEFRIAGSSNFSHFYFGSNEDTYIRGGKSGSNVLLNDISNGRVGIGMSNPRVALEQNGVVGNTAAIFGGEGSGISVQRDWPAIGFNHWFDGSTHRSIGQGYSAQLGVNQVNGSLYLASWPFAAGANASLGSFTQRFYVSRFGKIGLGTDDPFADIEIIQRGINYGDPNETDNGITYKGTNLFNNTNTRWNTHVGYGDNGTGVSLDFYSFWTQYQNGPWVWAAAIGSNGNYYQPSDLGLKKDITYLENTDCLQKIIRLKPASYHFKRDSQNHPLSYGFIAQDVEQIFPEFVLSGKTNKLLSYSSFIPILTKGIQEQQQQIEELKKENETLKARLDRLEEMVLKN